MRARAVGPLPPCSLPGHQVDARATAVARVLVAGRIGAGLGLERRARLVGVLDQASARVGEQEPFDRRARALQVKAERKADDHQPPLPFQLPAAVAMDLEGTEVAAWLNSIGVTAIVLKYRVPTGSFDPNWLGPTMDAQRAISMARKNAQEWGIDPTRIGVLGFSAGGKTAAMAALACGKRLYAPQDDVDAAPCNADFGVLVYPAYLVDKNNQLNAEVKATKECPPMFFAHTSDDPVTPQSTLVLAGALQSQKVPVEVHLYPNGGHGYGLRPDKTKQVTSWPERCAEWMRNRGIIR